MNGKSKFHKTCKTLIGDEIKSENQIILIDGRYKGTLYMRYHHV